MIEGEIHVRGMDGVKLSVEDLAKVAEKVADAVEFVEVDEPKEPKKPVSVSFEEL